MYKYLSPKKTNVKYPKSIVYLYEYIQQKPTSCSLFESVSRETPSTP